MTLSVPVRPGSALRLAATARALLHWVSCSNPFYVISAGLFLVGLRLSFPAQASEVETWSLMGGLAGYTLLLALTAFLLVRFARAWQDLRTVLLLVVLMLLATSVTFDEVLIVSPRRGLACCLTGLLVTVLVSEGVLRGIRLKLPAWYRAPFYLIMALFFLYPLGLAALADQPHSRGLQWALFGFSAVAGLVFLSLLPGIRRGPSYVQDNGSPWNWPAYPWALFGLLALAVPARAYFLCWSMHVLPSPQTNLMFGMYFVIPFGLALVVLFLEMAMVAGQRGMLWIALAAPWGVLLLALVGHRPDPIYQEFLERFTTTLGGSPLYLSLIGLVGLYGYAMLRRVPHAADMLTAALVVFSTVAPGTLDAALRDGVAAAPIAAAAALQLLLGWRRREVWRCLLGAEGLALAVGLLLPDAAMSLKLRLAIVTQLELAGTLAVGAAFYNKVGRLIRDLAACGMLLAVVFESVGLVPLGGEVPASVLWSYALIMALILATYGILLRHRLSITLGMVAAFMWLASWASSGYLAARDSIAGMDHILWSLILFIVAVLISVMKAGRLLPFVAAWSRRLLAFPGPTMPQAVDNASPGG